MRVESLLAQGFVYLAAAVVSVPISKRLGLGSVLGYLLAGAVVGPHALELVGEERGDVMHFAEFGVVMMLFLVGLELEPARLWRLRIPILGLGGLQVALTAAFVAAGLSLFGLPLATGLAVGLILGMSSTAIVVQTLTEKGLLGTQAGQSSFSVLLFQDLAVIPILAVMPLLAHGAATHAADGGSAHAGPLDGLPDWQRALVVLAAVSAIVLAGRYLVRPVFRFVAETRIREVFTAMTLLIVVGITLVMQAVGLSPALGTFLAGVVLADSEYRHELETDIEPFKGLLLGVFFIAVGASIDFSLVAAEPGRLIGCVFALIAVKAGVLFALGRLMRLPTQEALLLGLALAQGGEFAFVLVSHAVGAGVLGAPLASFLTGVVALSMAVTPLLFLMYERVLLPALSPRDAGAEREHDVEDESHPVIIAGYGRFGQIVSRLLTANGIGNTVLDNNPGHIDMLRRFGAKCFYGDAAREDLLRAAGAERARVLVVAVDDADAASEIVSHARKAFPHLELVVRTRGRPDAQDLLKLGVRHVVRETFGSALDAGVEVLRCLGWRAHQAHRRAATFRHHDDSMMRELAAQRDDQKRYVSEMNRRRAILEDVLKQDRAHLEDIRDDAWDGAPPREETATDNPSAA